MPSTTLKYPTQPYSKVNRYDTRGENQPPTNSLHTSQYSPTDHRPQASYALETIHQIVNTCPILHVSFAAPDSPFPTMLPMIGQMGSFARPSADTGDVLELYLHGYVSSRLMNLARKADDNGSAEANGLPITIGASHVDGLVLSLTPNSHSYNYRSATLFGQAVPVTDVAEKLYAMQLITEGIVRGRWAGTRVPPNGAEMQSTSVLRVSIAAGSAKVRTGMPSDDRADMEDGALLDRVWTGVVPVHYAMGEPMPSPYNRVEKVPAYLEEFRTGFNDDAVEGAVEAATKSMAAKAKKGDS
ncbi:Uu.00g127990.m01.CDS01 [Anthostomella pinea]|uniref:Uu.00g127990.m01.CDS01 n=1 Tax=Anthostomella pinea TaxID=933095 RepID=A0AAI8VI88_9PEZI|nr:Uu.00g127990.m01.CDS01 [Anthostomella pinea]